MADDSSAFADLGCRLLRDDGAVVYLNGTEIWRDNLPVEPIAFDTRANVAIKTSEEGVFPRTNIPSKLLPTGTNVVAVEIHQVSPFSSTDVSFDFELTGTANLAPAQLSASLAANQL